MEAIDETRLSRTQLCALIVDVKDTNHQTCRQPKKDRPGQGDKGVKKLEKEAESLEDRRVPVIPSPVCNVISKKDGRAAH